MPDKLCHYENFLQTAIRAKILELETITDDTYFERAEKSPFINQASIVLWLQYFLRYK